ncbi:DUF4079 domain-containing protein [Rubidibacter lacunae]|nr:DUF4079 domain-containing protein [Rubidibacter lacunae]
MDLPSFLWLWKIAAWSMGLVLTAYVALAATGMSIALARKAKRPRPRWLRPLHYGIGGTMVALVLLLLSIGVVGTLGHFGTLGHSLHLAAGLTAVVLVLVSAGSATQIGPKHPRARSLHVGINILLLLGFTWVGLTGWTVVQKYL